MCETTKALLLVLLPIFHKYMCVVCKYSITHRTPLLVAKTASDYTEWYGSFFVCTATNKGKPAVPIYADLYLLKARGDI